MRVRHRIGGVIAGVILAAVAVAAQTGERLSDKQVKAIIDEVDTGRDKFEGNLDGGFKGSTLRGPRTCWPMPRMRCVHWSTLRPP